MQATGLLTYLTIIGAAFVTWFIVVALFAPRIDYQLRARLACTSREFLHTLQTTCQAALHRNNRFEILTNASQFYPAMLAAIRGAQRTVNMECYTFVAGRRHEPGAGRQKLSLRPCHGLARRFSDAD